MQQLTGLDTSFLVMEAGGQLGHVGSLCLYDTKGLRGRSLIDAFGTALEARLHLLPPYRRRLVEVPLGLDRPYWVEDPDFDLDYHLRHIAVPPPGDDAQLASLVARIHGRALDGCAAGAEPQQSGGKEAWRMICTDRQTGSAGSAPPSMSKDTTAPKPAT